MVMCGAGLVTWTSQLSLSRSCLRCSVMLNVTVSLVAFVHIPCGFLAGIPLQRAQQGHYGLGSLITHRDMRIQVVRQLPSQSNPVILFLFVPTPVATDCTLPQWSNLVSNKVIFVVRIGFRWSGSIKLETSLYHLAGGLPLITLCSSLHVGVCAPVLLCDCVSVRALPLAPSLAL